VTTSPGRTPRTRGALATVVAAVLMALGCTAGAAEQPRPWHGADRAAWVQKAAERAFRLGEEMADLQKVPELFATPLPRAFFIRREDLPREVTRELHVLVNAGQPKPIIDDDGRVTIVPVEVTVRPTERPVVLVLASSESVIWHVQALPDARIDAVYVDCPKRCDVRGTPEAQALPAKSDKDGGPSVHRYGSYDGDGEDTLSQVAGVLGMPVMSAQGRNESGAYQVPVELDRSVLREIISARADVERRRTVSPPGPFVVVDGAAIVRTEVSTGRSTMTPTRRIRAVTATTEQGEYFGLGLGTLLRIDPTTGEASSVATPPGLPPIAWSGGIAYDQRTARVIVTQPASAGVHHLYTPATDTWETAPVERTGGGLHALAYVPSLHVLYGLRGGRTRWELVSLDPELNVVATIALAENLLRLSRLAPIQMAAVAESLAVCQPGRDGGTTRVSGCLLVDPASGDVRLLRTGDAP